MIETTSPDLFDLQTKARVDAWLSGAYDEETKTKILALLKENPKDLIDAFYKNLSFGTGGMRGIMGVGSNRMNLYTVRTTTQGLSNYLLQQFPNQPLSVFISYDSRHNSKNFAEEAAKVLAGNNIHVYLTREIRPTPLVSFGCRLKKCNAGVMITASHNPPEYNGYKVYWSDGGQILPPHDTGIMSEVEKIQDINQVSCIDNLNHPLIHLVEEEIDDAYLESILSLPLYREANLKSGPTLKIIYTSLHGTGITLAPRALRLWGFTSLQFVNQQIAPNGDFPTVHFPNPEEKEALNLGIQTLEQEKADLLIATDPDADRVGVVAMHEGKPYIFNGNQIACLCLEHICQALSRTHKMPDQGAFVKTIVTSELFRAITVHYGTHCFDVLTGFKYIAELIHKWEEDPNGYQYIFGGEESYGYLFGTFSRDKDAISSSVLIAEAALQAKLQGKTLVNFLHDLFAEYGIYEEQVTSLNYEESKEGHLAMAEVMKILREDPLNEIGGQRILSIDDYQILQHHDLVAGTNTPLLFPTSDVLVYWLEDGSKLMIRPSGTETKIKIYCSIIEKEYEGLEQGLEKARGRAQKMLEAIKELLTKKPSSP